MGQWISVFLQAAGILMLLWGLMGWVLSGQDQGGAVVFSCLPGSSGRQEAFLRFYLFWRETGIFRMPLILVDCGLSEGTRTELAKLIKGRTDVTICPESDLEERMRMEARQHGGTGTAAG